MPAARYESIYAANVGHGKHDNDEKILIIANSCLELNKKNYEHIYQVYINFYIWHARNAFFAHQVRTPNQTSAWRDWLTLDKQQGIENISYMEGQTK